MSNNHIVMGLGKPNSGKSSSLRNLPADKTAYINFDSKPVPFPMPFYKNIKIDNVDHVLAGLDSLEKDDQVEYIVVDTITFMMEMFENQKVVPKAGTKEGMTAWSDYAQFYITFLHKIKNSSKKIIVFGHTADVFNETEAIIESKVPVKGAIGKRGVEADFTIILGNKKVQTSKLKGKDNDLLEITEFEEEDGFKYVFETRITKETMNEKIRSPMGLWSRDELYIDNDIVLVMNRITEYYKK